MVNSKAGRFSNLLTQEIPRSSNKWNQYVLIYLCTNDKVNKTLRLKKIKTFEQID